MLYINIDVITIIIFRENISSVIQKSIEVQTSWSKMRTDDQLSFIENISVVMDKNWNSHFKMFVAYSITIKF